LAFQTQAFAAFLADPSKPVIPGGAMRRSGIHKSRHSGRSSAETRNPGFTINWIPAYAGMTLVFRFR
jgi:hypothetical protein